MADSRNGKSLQREIDQLEEEIRQLEKKLGESRDDGPEDEHLSFPQAWLLILAGALGIGGTGHIASLEFQILLKTEGVLLMDPGIGFAKAIQNGLRALGSWAPPTAFSLGFLLLLYLTLWPSFRNSENNESLGRPGGDWRAWALALCLIAIPFFNFETAGYVMGLPIGIGVACGLYGIGLGLAKSEGLRELFRHFRKAWFGGLLAFAAVGLMISGFVLERPAIVLPGMLIFSCFSLHLMSIGFEKRTKVRAWEHLENRIRKAKAELERLWKAERIEQELRELLDE